MSDELTSFTGPERAAIFLMSVGEDSAAEVLKHMGPKEVQALGSAMASVQSVSASSVNAVLSHFVETVGEHSSLGMDSQNYIRNVLVQALGKDKAGSLIDRILMGGDASGLETLKWMDSKTVADMLRNEHPQVVAIVLSYLDADQAGDVLSNLSEKVRVDLLMRIAALDSVQPQALQELNQLLEQQVQGDANMQSAAVGGVKTAAEILNFVDSTIEGEIMDTIRESDADLGQQIQDLMFVFDNLSTLDDPAVQALLREVSSESLLIALKGTDEGMREKFFGNMSKRAAEMMRDDLEAKGPVKLSEVETAQKEIVGIARRMADEGTISLGGAGGEEYV